MISSKRPTDLERARWLAELSDAISQAEHLAWRLGYAEGDSGDARALHARLVAMRAELEALRSSWAAAPAEIDPLWANLFPPG